MFSKRRRIGEGFVPRLARRTRTIRSRPGFFETWFRPYLVTVRSAQDGLFTGYFEAELQGARAQDETFKYPLYGIPSDLISVDLGCFDGRLRGRSVIGRVEGGRMLPYYRRADIERGSIGRRAKVLAWVDDRIDAFLLHVQGSGRILLPDGDVLRIGYAGNNGHGTYRWPCPDKEG